MKLPKHEDFPCGPWVPCVIMEKERNKVALNPHSRVPIDFFQGEKAKTLNDSDFYLPQFHNTILVKDFETSIFQKAGVNRANVSIDSEQQSLQSDENNIILKDALIHFKKVDDFCACVKEIRKSGTKSEIIFGDILSKAVKDDTFLPEHMRDFFKLYMKQKVASVP